MNKYYYDLHTHSCLSPCGDSDNTPNNIAGMATLCGLDIVALTDHNTSKNCPAFFEAAERCGIVPIAGMELTTSEDIHVVCLFERLCDAMCFDKFIEGRRILIKNKTEIFGEQLILDGEDNVIGTEEYLLPNATNISIEEIYSIASRFSGVCYPAHIDRDANGIIAILGDLPRDSDFKLYELNDRKKISEFSERYGIPEGDFIIGSDAHYLTDMRDGEAYFLLDAPKEDHDALRRELFRLLRR